MTNLGGSGKRKGSRRYRTLTYHYQREPKIDLKEPSVTYNQAQAFLNNWEQLYRDAANLIGGWMEGAKVVRQRDRVAAFKNNELLVQAFFEEEKERPNAKDEKR
jgi:hypothetical protein